jgi:hypothetical protein
VSESSVMQMALFLETNTLLDELKELDVNSPSPAGALNKMDVDPERKPVLGEVC